MRSFYTLSIWILLGTFAGYGFLTLVGLGDKNEYSSRAFNFEIFGVFVGGENGKKKLLH